MVNKEGEMKDSLFMDTEEKNKVLKQWDRFLRNGCTMGNFTKDLYKHLYLHCGFMAHFDRYGFYSTYFENPGDTIKFFRQFDKDFECRSIELNMTYWLYGEYEDINVEMCNILDKYKKEMYEKLLRKAREDDIEMAKMLLGKHGIII